MRYNDTMIYQSYGDDAHAAMVDGWIDSSFKGAFIPRIIGGTDSTCQPPTQFDHQ